MNDLYLQAAQAMDLGYDRQCHPIGGCCIAISALVDDGLITSAESGQACTAFEEMFEPEDALMSYWGNYWSEDLEERQACRVLALLFMHWASQ